MLRDCGRTRLEPTAETPYKLALPEPCFPQAPNYAPLTDFNKNETLIFVFSRQIICRPFTFQMFQGKLVCDKIPSNKGNQLTANKKNHSPFLSSGPYPIPYNIPIHHINEYDQFKYRLPEHNLYQNQ